MRDYRKEELAMEAGQKNFVWQQGFVYLLPRIHK